MRDMEMTQTNHPQSDFLYEPEDSDCERMEQLKTLVEFAACYGAQVTVLRLGEMPDLVRQTIKEQTEEDKVTLLQMMLDFLDRHKSPFQP